MGPEGMSRKKYCIAKIFVRNKWVEKTSAIQLVVAVCRGFEGVAGYEVTQGILCFRRAHRSCSRIKVQLSGGKWKGAGRGESGRT